MPSSATQRCAWVSSAMAGQMKRACGMLLKHEGDGAEESLVLHVSAKAARVDDDGRGAFTFGGRVEEVALHAAPAGQDGRWFQRVEAPIASQAQVAAAVRQQGIGAR